MKGTRTEVVSVDKAEPRSPYDTKTWTGPSIPGLHNSIALTVYLCKLMERMGNSRLEWFIEKNVFLSKTQDGSRTSQSTTGTFLHLETARKRFWLPEFLIAEFLDFQKAYDMMWIKDLLFKLDSIGVKSNMFSLIRSFLDKRTI